jgi:putative tryptophan/tyrosine transport system substrate-binding protein
VFAGPSDPVGSGLVDNLARPGGNVTGMTDQGVDLTAKRLQLLKQVVRRLKRVMVLGSASDPVWEPVWSELQPAARHLGIDVTPALMATPDQLEAIFSDLSGTAQGLYVAPQQIFWQHRHQIAGLAARAKLPSIYEAREFVQAGGFISYGTDYIPLVRDTARYVDRILKGAKPGDLPVEQPRKFNLAINLSTAKALRVTVPEALLLHADELIR